MNQIYPDIGLPILLERIFSNGLIYHLFDNDVVVDRTILIGGAGGLNEAAWAGYAPSVINPLLWSSFNGPGHIGVAIGPTLTFSNTSGGLVTAFGYYVTDSGSGLLVMAAKFDVPLDIDDGETTGIPGFLTFKSEADDSP